jgi:hypothetical protein
LQYGKIYFALLWRKMNLAVRQNLFCPALAQDESCGTAKFILPCFAAR